MYKFKSSDYISLIESWLVKANTEGRTYCNRMKYKNDSLYSYSTRIAQIDRDNNFMFITSHKYSNTTSRQIRKLIDLIPDKYRVFPLFTRPRIAYDYFVTNIITAQGKYKRAYKHKQNRRRELEQLITEAHDFVSILALHPNYIQFNIPDRMEELHKHIFEAKLQLGAN